MFLFELVIALLLVGAVLSFWADRVAALSRAARACRRGLALIPGVPEVTLDPELALALFVAPTLLDAAFDASPRDLRDNLEPVVSSRVVTVVATVAAVALVAHAVVPDIGWAAAITLGAIVAPPDASAATAVLRRLRRRTAARVLEGESLFNDATALLVYRVAVGAAVTGIFSGWRLADAGAHLRGGVVAGWLLARLFLGAMRIEDIPIFVLCSSSAPSACGCWPSTSDCRRSSPWSPTR